MHEFLNAEGNHFGFKLKPTHDVQEVTQSTISNAPEESHEEGKNVEFPNFQLHEYDGVGYSKENHAEEDSSFLPPSINNKANHEPS